MTRNKQNDCRCAGPDFDPDVPCPIHPKQVVRSRLDEALLAGNERRKDRVSRRPSSAVKLTKDQLAELKRLAHEPQRSYGKGRVRVHNNLRRFGLASIDHSDGFMCHITQAGRDFLAHEVRR